MTGNAEIVSVTESEHGTTPGAVKVWDPFIRTFHWLLAVLFASAWYTGGIWDSPHLISGYAVVVVVLARIIWGFVGPRYARFSDFVHGPKAIIRFLADTLHMRAPRYVGHNPAGGAMVIV